MLFGLVLGMFLIVNVSAGIYFSQPEQTYNLGDEITNTIKIDPIGEGFLKVDLVCEDSSLNVFNGIPLEGEAEIQFPLTTAYIQNISGDCYFLGEYNGEDKESRGFKISKALVIRLDIDSLFAKPGEEIIISGSAERLNKVGVDGEVEIRIIGLLEPVEEIENNETEEDEEDTEDDIDNNETEVDNNETEVEEIVGSVVYDSGSFFGIVKEGLFSVDFTLAKDTPAQDYRIEVLVYEKSGSERTSEGKEIANLKISQILTSVDIALSAQSLDPGSEFNFKPMLLDQTGRNIDEDVTVVIVNDDSDRIFERIVQSEETIDYNIPANMSSGYYEIQASNTNISIMKKFYVKEKAIVSLELRNETLLVTCIGNQRCENSIQIELNGKPFVKNVDLKIGEVQEFKLTGTSGTYDVKISDGETELIQSGVVLTGNAIGVKEIGNGVGVALKTPMVWIFFIIILGAGVLFIFRNVLKKKSFAYPFKGKFGKKKVKDLSVTASSESAEKSKKVDEKVEPKVEGNKEKVQSSQSPIQNQAEQVLVLKGQKNQAAVLVLKVKNKLSKVSKESLEKAISVVYEKKGAVYEQGDFIYIIYSPLMTKSFKNEAEAAKSAEKIKLILQEHNKKFKDKIEFGIGIGSGNIINKIEDKKLKFTALGNLISSAKRIADSSNEQVLVTKEAYEKGINEIKAEKKEIKGSEVYEVRQVLDKEKNKEFIASFLKRMSGEGK